MPCFFAVEHTQQQTMVQTVPPVTAKAPPTERMKTINLTRVVRKVALHQRRHHFEAVYEAALCGRAATVVEPQMRKVSRNLVFFSILVFSLLLPCFFLLFLPQH